MVETARELAGVFPVPVPRPFGLIAAGARNELQFSKNSLRVKYARLVLTQLVKLALKRFDSPAWRRTRSADRYLSKPAAGIFVTDIHQDHLDDGRTRESRKHNGIRLPKECRQCSSEPKVGVAMIED
jgi:L-ascorbate metabolism protein UlaG (beta-lactamase superfamily)